jgi:hypothetical protein
MNIGKISFGANLSPNGFKLVLTKKLKIKSL